MTSDDVVPGTMAISWGNVLYVVVKITEIDHDPVELRHVVVMTDQGWRRWAMDDKDAKRDTLVRRGRTE